MTTSEIANIREISKLRGVVLTDEQIALIPEGMINRIHLVDTIIQHAHNCSINYHAYAKCDCNAKRYFRGLGN